VITRRKFLAGASALAVTAALFSAADFGRSPAFAQPAGPSVMDLMASGGLDERVLGKDDAPVTIIEYASMTCGHCAAFHVKTYPELKKRYIDTGKVRFILREFPLDLVAAGAFALARCAGKDKHYAIVDTLFEQQKDWAFVSNPRMGLFNFAKQFGFTEQTFNACVSDKNMMQAMENGIKRASEKFGVNSTPTFFIVAGMNSKKLSGAMSIDDLAKEIDPLIQN
jgi:protein-disulfide isomerase